MEQMDIQAEKEYWEKKCADIFVDWLYRTTGITYRTRKAEEKFPDLTGRDRWDFVAEQENCSDWIAIEVKEVTVPGEHIGHAFWSSVFSGVNREVKGRLKGTFSIFGHPDLNVDLKKRNELVKAISQVILEKSTQITSSSAPIDIWPDIIKYLQNKYSHDWASNFFTNLNTSLIPGKVSKASLYLRKHSDEGSYVGIAISSSSGTADEEQKAAVELFKPKSGRVRPNHQLGVAKARGASSGFLLLNADDWQIEDIRRALACASHDDSCNIDAAYLIDISHSLVYQVWPIDTKTTALNQYHKFNRLFI